MSFSLHVIGSRQGGGAERFFVRLVTALAERGHRTEAVVAPDSWVDRQLPAEVVRHRIPMRSVHDPLARWRLGRLIRHLQPDIVQTWMGRATRLVRLPPGNRPVHVARLGGYYDLKGYRHAHAWIGNTRGICTYLEQGGLPAGRVFHIGNFVEPPRRIEDDELATWRTRLALPDAAFPILALGRVHPNKAFDTLLHAFRLLVDRLPAATTPILIIGGSGPQEETLHALARDLEIEDRVRWTGWVDDPAPLRALAECFVCPSRHEPLGNVILEAWNHRLAVVTTACDGPRELVEDGKNGLLVPVDRPEAMAEALRRLLEDPELRHRLGEAGGNTLEHRFSPGQIVKSYETLYEALTGSVGQA